MALGSYLYRRVYSVYLQPPDKTSAIAFGNTNSNESALRITFSLEKKAQSAPNKGTITLYNLNRQTRGAISMGWNVRVRAGYQDYTDTIFIGRVGIVNTTREGPDIATSLQVTEGFSNLIETPFNRSYPPNTHVAKVLRDIAKTMSVGVGVVRDIPDTVYAKGLTLSHSCRDALDVVLKPLNMEAFVSNERLNVLPKDRAFGTTAVLVSKNTGMVNTPTVEKREVNFESLLIPQLTVPGQLVQIVTDNALAAGFFKIRSVKVEGDTYGEKWSTACNCARIDGYTIKPITSRGFDFGAAVKELL